MKKDDFFKGMYDDFFGIGKIERENEKLRNDIKNLKGIDIEETEANIPSIEVTHEDTERQESTTIDKDKFMEDVFKKIDELYIEEASKNTLKKIVEYIRKYNEKIEKQFISFNMSINANNKETFEGILRVLNDSINFFQYLPNGDIGIISCYDIQNAEDIAKIYSSDNNIIAFNTFNGLYSKDLNDKAKIINKFEESVSENENKYLTILYAQNKDELNDLFLSSDKLKNEFAEFNIIGRSPDVQEAYNEILGILNKNSTVTEDIQIKLLDYISNTLPKIESNYPDYRDNLVQKISFNKQVPEYEQNKSIDEIFEELDSLVGLEKVKKMLRELVDLISLKEKSKDILNIKSINLHMVFLGNPGTGKTTVARIVSKILYNLKYIKQDKLLEVTSKDLVAEYVGQTSIKTANVVQKALGGVLFIDEAYSLASGKGEGNSFNEEAVATLIQAMENNRDNLVVIFAGYTKEMQDFLNLNSGIVSRIGYTVEFEDYTVDELWKIFNQMMTKAGFVVSKEAEDKVKKIIEENKGTRNFGNARFVRNVYEKSIIKHASNTKDKKSKKALVTIKAEDISTENL